MSVTCDAHPTTTPAALIERVIGNSCRRCGIALDLLGGPGSIRTAAGKTGPQDRLVELDPKYVDVVVKRWQDWTGGTATLDRDERSYEGLEAERTAVSSPPIDEDIAIVPQE